MSDADPSATVLEMALCLDREHVEAPTAIAFALFRSERLVRLPQRPSEPPQQPLLRAVSLAVDEGLAEATAAFVPPLPLRKW